MTTIYINLQNFISSYPEGVFLMDDDKRIASDYCGDKQDYVDFVKEHADKLTEDTEVSITFSMEDIGDTAVLEYGSEVALAIKEELKKLGKFKGEDLC